jgi:hypothetical protein
MFGRAQQSAALTSCLSGSHEQSGGAIQRRCSWQLAARTSIACVWLYQGLWCKVVAPNQAHHEVVASLPGLTEHAVPYALAALGAIETMIALWVLSGTWLRRAAIVQTVLLVAMNAGGLVCAQSAIHDPAGMLTANAVLLALAWGIAIPRGNR